MKQIVVYAAIAAFGCLLSGPASAQAEKREISSLKMAVVMRCATNDFSWCQASHNGLVEMKQKYGVEFAFQEPVSNVDAERVIRGFAEQGYDLILAENTGFQDAALKVAEDYPTINFATVAGYVTRSPGAADSPAMGVRAVLAKKVVADA